MQYSATGLHACTEKEKSEAFTGDEVGSENSLHPSSFGHRFDCKLRQRGKARRI